MQGTAIPDRSDSKQDFPTESALYECPFVLILMSIRKGKVAGFIQPRQIGYDSGLPSNQDCKSDPFFR